MRKMVKDQINFNTVLILVIGALISFGIKKLDDNNTLVIQLAVKVADLDMRVVRTEDSIRDIKQKLP